MSKTRDCWTCGIWMEAKMKDRLIIVFLALSLALNIGVLSILAFRWLSPKEQHERRKPQARLDGGNHQEPNSLQELRKHMQEARLQNKENVADAQRHRTAFMTALASDDFKEKQARAALKEYLNARIKLENGIGENLIKLRLNIEDPKTEEIFKRRINKRSEMLQNHSLQDSVALDSLHYRRAKLRSIIRERIKQRKQARRQFLDE